MTSEMPAGDDTAAELRALLDAAVDAVIVIDVRGSIVEFNSAAERLFGYKSSEVVGEDVKVLMPEPYRGEHQGYIRRYLETGEAKIIGMGREVEGRRSDGSTFPVALSVGEVAGVKEPRFVGLIRDLSAQKEAEGEARRLQNRLAYVGRFSLMGEMAAGLAHEINQPLSAIATYAQAGKRLMGAESVELDELRSTCDKISEQAQRAGQVIEKLRNFMKKQEVRKDALEVNQIVSSTINLIEADARAESISVRAKYGHDLPRVSGDAVQLQQVLLNLTHNAVDAMKNGLNKEAGILVTTEVAEEDSVAVTVTDHGHGVSAQLVDTIFNPFVTTKRDGLGVGLAISRTIVQAHGGDLYCRENPAGGAVFGFSLPVFKGD